jgi:hypothetical protein
MTRLQNGTPAPATEAGPEPWTVAARKVFIVGAPRSGTTWLQAMLASHPCVATGPETAFFKTASALEAAFLEKAPRPAGLAQYLTAEEFYQSLADLFHRATAKVHAPEGPCRYFVEKTPEHCYFAALILRCLPGARFIHLLRDGRHVVSSLLRAEREWDSRSPARSVAVAGEVWRTSVQAARRVPELLPDPEDYREVRYEELRRAPHEQLRRLFAWLGLPADAALVDAVVARNELEKVRQSRGFDAIRQPGPAGAGPAAEPEGFFGQGAARPDAFGLTRLQEHQCYRVFGRLLHELGYCPRVPAVPWWATLACSWKVRALLRLPQV